MSSYWLSNHTVRLVFASQSAACAALLGYAYYLQYVEYLAPCPMCIMQRFCFLLIGLISLIAALHNPKSWMLSVYTLGNSLFAIVGALIAGRQWWLQYHPSELSECGGGLYSMLNTMPLLEALTTALQGTSDCGEIQWTFLALSIPAWAMLWFLGLLAVNLTLMLYPVRCKIFCCFSNRCTKPAKN